MSYSYKGPMNMFIHRFRSAILDSSNIDPHDDRLLIERHGKLACHYAPFDHINRDAKIVLLGITPGAQQAGNALTELAAALHAGVSQLHALELAKQTASFSGPMRKNLIAMLDRIGLPAALEVESCARLFDTRSDLVHFTSALRYPVFVDGKDYSGSPSILATPVLREMTRRWLHEEIALLQEAFWVPLGKEPAAVLDDCIARGDLDARRVLTGLPHPSGANAERIAYFLGTKKREALSAKTNPELIDAAYLKLTHAVAAFASNEPRAPQPSTFAAPAQLPAQPSPAGTVPATRSTVPRPTAPASQTVTQAEALIAAKLERITPGNRKVAGFQTALGRHLAIQRDVQGINVWTEDLCPPRAIASFERYPANRRRHSNLDAQAPRVGNERDARLWKIASTDELVALLRWYDQVTRREVALQVADPMQVDVARGSLHDHPELWRDP